MILTQRSALSRHRQATKYARKRSASAILDERQTAECLPEDVRPPATRAAQMDLCALLAGTLQAADRLELTYVSRPPPTKTDEELSRGRAYRDFCSRFCATGDGRRREFDLLAEGISARRAALRDTQARLDELERRGYRIEMNLE
jgi:hypothetical protein